MPQRIAFIGLGVMGQRMLGNMHTHDDFKLQAGWDPDDAACRITKETYPEITIGASAEEIINSPDTDVVYIACPPLWHGEYVTKTIASGKPVFCEKPLGVDVADSRAMVEQIEASGLINAVNFPFARAPAVEYIRSELAAEALGEIVGVDARFHFSSWPRDWQMDAAEWLSRREQGGFTREVFSHYAYLIERLFGPARLISSHATYPDGPKGEMSESHLLSSLRPQECRCRLQVRSAAQALIWLNLQSGGRGVLTGFSTGTACAPAMTVSGKKP